MNTTTTTRRSRRAATWAAPIAAAALIASGCAVGSADAGMTPSAPVASSAADGGSGATGAVRAASYIPAGVALGAPAVGMPLVQAAGNGSGKFVGMKVTPKKAAKKARAAHSRSKVIGISLDDYRGAQVWEVTVVSKTGRWEVSVNVMTGAVVRDKTDDLSDRARDLARVKDAKVRYKKAINTVLKAHPKSGLDGLELDMERGQLVWQAEIVTRGGAQYDVDVNATTGAIVKNKLDD